MKKVTIRLLLIVSCLGLIKAQYTGGANSGYGFPTGYGTPSYAGSVGYGSNELGSGTGLGSSSGFTPDASSATVGGNPNSRIFGLLGRIRGGRGGLFSNLFGGGSNNFGSGGGYPIPFPVYSPGFGGFGGGGLGGFGAGGLGGYPGYGGGFYG